MSKDKRWYMGKSGLQVLPPGLEAKLVLEEAELKSFLNGRF